MTMAELISECPTAKYASERRSGLPTDVSLTGSDSLMNTATSHSMKTAALAAYVATTTGGPLSSLGAAELKATARQQLEPPERLFVNLNKEEERSLTGAQEKLRQQRQVELLQRQQELGRRLLVLEEEQQRRQRNEAILVGADEWSSWRWITSTASDAATDEEDVYNDTSHANAYTSSVAFSVSNFKRPSEREKQHPRPYYVAESEYQPQMSSHSNALVAAGIPPHTSAAPPASSKDSVRLHSEKSQSEQQVCLDIAAAAASSQATASGPAWATTAVGYDAIATDTRVPAAAVAPAAAAVSHGSSQLSFPHVLWQEDEDFEAGEKVQPQPGSLGSIKGVADSAATPPPLQASAAAGASVIAPQCSSSRINDNNIQQQELIRYPFPEAAVLWDSSSSCCSDNAPLTSIVDEEQCQQQLQQQQQLAQQQEWLQQQRIQVQNVLRPVNSAAAAAAAPTKWRDDVATQVAQLSSSNFSFYGDPVLNGERDCDRGASTSATPPTATTRTATTPPTAASLVEPVNVAYVNDQCSSRNSNAGAREKKTNAFGKDKRSCESANAARSVNKGSLTVVAGAADTVEISTTTVASSFRSPSGVRNNNHKLCAVAGEGGTVDAGYAIPSSRSSPVICGAAEYVSTHKIANLLPEGRRVFPAAAAAEAAERGGHAFVQSPITPTSSPRTIVPLHRHWVQQLLLHQKKQQQRVHRLIQQQQQKLQQQRRSQLVVESQQQRQHVRQQQQEEVQQQQEKHKSQQHVARDEQQHQQPRRRDRVLLQGKVIEQIGENEDSLDKRGPLKVKNAVAPPPKESKLFRGRGKASASALRHPSGSTVAASHAPGECDKDNQISATHISAAAAPPSTLPTDDSTVAAVVPVVAYATSSDCTAAPPVARVTLSTASTNNRTAAATAVPTSDAGGSDMPIGTAISLEAAAAAASACHPVLLPGVAAVDTYDCPPTAVADTFCMNAAAAATEAPSSLRPSSFAAAAAASAPAIPVSHFMSRAPPLPRPSIRTHLSPLSLSTSESLRHVHAGSCVAGAAAASSHAFPLPGNVSAIARDAAALDAAAAAASIACPGVATALVKTTAGRNTKTRGIIAAPALNTSNLSSSLLSLQNDSKEREEALQQPAAAGRRSSSTTSAVAAAATAGTALHSIDLRRKYASSTATARGATAAVDAAAAGGSSSRSLSAASASTAGMSATSFAIHEVASRHSSSTSLREKGLAVVSAAAAPKKTERTETCMRKSSLRCTTSEQIKGKDGQHMSRNRSSSSRVMKGQGSNSKSQRKEAANALQSIQTSGVSVNEQQKQQQQQQQLQRDLQQSQQQPADGELVVRGLHVTKQQLASAEEMQQQQEQQQQQWVLQEDVHQTRGGRNDVERRGQQMKQQQILKEEDGDGMVNTLQKLRNSNRLLHDTSEIKGSQFKHEQQGRRALCFSGSSSHHDCNSSSSGRRNSAAATAAAEKKKKRTTNADINSHLSRSNNTLSQSAMASSNLNKGCVREMREAKAAASRKTRSVTRDRISIEKDRTVKSKRNVRTAETSSKEKMSPAASSRNNKLQQLLLIKSIDSKTSKETGVVPSKEQQKQQHLLHADKRKEEVNIKEISSSFSRIEQALFTGIRRDAAGVLLDTSCGAAERCSSSSSRSKNSSSDTSCTTPSAILHRLRRLLRKDSYSSCLSSQYNMHRRQNRGRKNQPQNKRKTHGDSSSSSRCRNKSSKNINSKGGSERVQRKTDYSSKRRSSRSSEGGSSSSSTRRDRNSSRSMDSLSSTTSRRTDSSRGSSSCKEIPEASRRMWKKLLAQTRRRLLDEGSRIGSSRYDTSVNSSRKYRRRRRRRRGSNSNTDSRTRTEVTSCYSDMSNSSNSSDVSSRSRTNSSDVSSSNSNSSSDVSNSSSEMSSSNSSTVSSNIFRHNHLKKSGHEPSTLKKHLRQKTMKRRDLTAAQNCLADIVNAPACRGGSGGAAAHRSRPTVAAAGGGPAADAARSSLPVAVAATAAPAASRATGKEKDPPPSLISLWLQYSAAALEDAEQQQQQRLLLPSSETLQQQLERKLQQKVEQSNSSKTRLKKKRHSRDERNSSSSSEGSSSSSEGSSSSSEGNSSSSEGSSSSSQSESSSETSHLSSHCRASDEEDASSLCLDPEAIIRRIKRRLRLPLLRRVKNRTPQQRQQQGVYNTTSVNSGNSEQPCQKLEPQRRRRRGRQQEQQQEEEQQEQWLAEGKSAALEDNFVGALERKENAVERQQQQQKSEHSSENKPDANSHKAVSEDYATALQQEQQRQRCRTEATGEDKEMPGSTVAAAAGSTAAAAAGTDDDPSGPLRLSALGSLIVSSSGELIVPTHAALREEKHLQQQQQQQEQQQQQQEHEENKKQMNVSCEKKQEQQHHPTEEHQGGDKNQRDHEAQELERLLLIDQEEQCNSLVCATAATADEDAASDVKQATETTHDTTTQILNSSSSAVAPAERNLQRNVSPLMPLEDISSRAVSSAAQAREASSSKDGYQVTAAGGGVESRGEEEEQRHCNDIDKDVFAVDKSHAGRRSNDYLLHPNTVQQQESVHMQPIESPEQQAEIHQQQQQQKAQQQQQQHDEKAEQQEQQKDEKMQQQQLMQQRTPRQDQPIVCQGPGQQMIAAVAIEQTIDGEESNLHLSQFEAISKLQLSLNGRKSYDDRLSQQQQSPSHEKPLSVLVPSAASDESSDPTALTHAASALPAAATGALSSTASSLFEAGSSSSNADMPIGNAVHHTLEAATVLADAAAVESRAAATKPVAVVTARAGYPATTLPAAAAAIEDEGAIAAIEDEAATAVIEDALSNGDTHATSVKRDAALVTSNRKQQATLAAAGGGGTSHFPAAVAAAAAGDFLNVRCASSAGSFSFSLSSSSGSSSVAEHMNTDLKKSSSNGRSLDNSNCSSLDNSNSTSRTSDNTANNSCCFRGNMADSSSRRLQSDDRKNCRNETDRITRRENHSSSENPRASTPAAAQLTAAEGGLLGLTSREPNDAPVHTATAADGAGAAEEEKGVTSEISTRAAARMMCEGPGAAAVAEASNSSSNGVSSRDVETLAVAMPATPPSWGKEETENGLRVLQRDRYYSDARESSSTSAACLQQPSQLLSQCTSSNCHLKEGDISHKDNKSTILTKEGETESNLSNASAASAASAGPSDVCGGLVTAATCAAVGATGAAAHHSPRAAAYCSDEDAVEARAAVWSLVEKTTTPPQVKKKQQQPQQQHHETLVVSHEVVLTRETPPPEVLDMVMQQQLLLHPSTKQFHLPSNRASYNTVSDTTSSCDTERQQRWWLRLLSGTEALEPTDERNIQQQRVPEQRAKQQVPHQNEQKRHGRKTIINDLQRSQQQAPRQQRQHGKSCRESQSCPRSAAAIVDGHAAATASLETIEGEKIHGVFEKLLQVFNVILDRNNDTGKVFACDNTVDHPVVKQRGSDTTCAVIHSHSAATGDEGVTAVGRPSLASHAGPRIREKDSERPDTTVAVEQETPADSVPDAVLASAASILRAAECGKGKESFVGAALTELEQFMRKREEFSYRRRGGKDVPLQEQQQPLSHNKSNSYVKQAEPSSSTHGQLLAYARKCEENTHNKKSNTPPRTGREIRNSRIEVDPENPEASEKKSHLSKNLSLRHCRVGTAETTEGKEEQETASRYHCLTGIRRGAAATIAIANAHDEKTHERHTGIMLSRGAHKVTAGCRCCSAFHMERYSPIRAQVVEDSTKKHKRVDATARKRLIRSRCKQRNTSLDSGCHNSRRLSHSTMNSIEAKNIHKRSTHNSSNTSQRNSSNSTERTDNRNIRRCEWRRRASETWHRHGRGATTIPGTRSREMRIQTGTRQRCSSSLRRARGSSPGDCRVVSPYVNLESSSDTFSTSSCGSRSCCCSSECEEHKVKIRGIALKQRGLHRRKLNTDNNENGRSLRSQPQQHCVERHHTQLRQHHKQRHRQRDDNIQVETDVPESRAHERSEEHFRAVAGESVGQCCAHDSRPQQRQMACSCTRRSGNTWLENNVHQRMSHSVSPLSPFFEEKKKTRDFLLPREQQPRLAPPSLQHGGRELLPRMKQESAQLPVGQVERMSPEQPDFAWCWREWGGCEIYKQQRNRLQAVLREALEGLA